MKSYSSSGRTTELIWPQGSSTSHCFFRKCSSTAMNMYKTVPPQLATDGPGNGTEQWLQSIYNINEIECSKCYINICKHCLNKWVAFTLYCQSSMTRAKNLYNKERTDTVQGVMYWYNFEDPFGTRNLRSFSATTMVFLVSTVESWLTEIMWTAATSYSQIC